MNKTHSTTPINHGPLSKAEIDALKVGTQPRLLSLPDGQEVLVRPVGARLFRDYRRCLRDEKGQVIQDRSEYVDELLVARVLVDESGNRLYSDQEVLEGCFDSLPPDVYDCLSNYAWQFVVDDDAPAGDREGNYSPTRSTAPS